MIHILDESDAGEDMFGNDYVYTHCGVDVTFGYHGLSVVRVASSGTPDLCPECRQSAFPTKEEIAAQKAARAKIIAETKKRLKK